MCLEPHDTACCAGPGLQKVLLSGGRFSLASLPVQSMAPLCCGLSKALDAVEHHMQKSFVLSSCWALSLCEGMSSQCVDRPRSFVFLCEL